LGSALDGRSGEAAGASGLATPTLGHHPGAGPLRRRWPRKEGPRSRFPFCRVSCATRARRSRASRLQPRRAASRRRWRAAQETITVYAIRKSFDLAVGRLDAYTSARTRVSEIGPPRLASPRLASPATIKRKAAIYISVSSYAAAAAVALSYDH